MDWIDVNDDLPELVKLPAFDGRQLWRSRIVEVRLADGTETAGYRFENQGQAALPGTDPQPWAWLEAGDPLKTVTPLAVVAWRDRPEGCE